MTVIPEALDSPAKHRLGLPARVLVFCAALILEKVLLDWVVGYGVARNAGGLGVYLHTLQHWGFRFLVAFFASAALIGYVRASAEIDRRTTKPPPIRPFWLAIHGFFLVLLLPTSYFLYRDGAGDARFVFTVSLWLLFALGNLISGFLIMAPYTVWSRGVRYMKPVWICAGLAALLGTCAWRESENLWESTASLTFRLVRAILTPILPTLVTDAESRVVGTDRFAVEITQVCSGLEGMGLMLAFSVAWLIFFRKEYRFPRALLLVPASLLAIFVLNALRICALVLIGHIGFPDVAAYGFHSQAGWIAFNAVACAIVFVSHRNRWMSRTGLSVAWEKGSTNRTAVYLMPLLAILAAGSLSHALSGGFETFYAFRLLAALTVIVTYRRELEKIDWRFTWRGIALGTMIFVVWIVSARALLPFSDAPAAFHELSPLLQTTWVITRFLISVLIVPIAEELAYRGFMMRRLMSRNFEAIRYKDVRWYAIGLSAVAFGLAHGAMWLPGIIAGVILALIVVRGESLGEAVAAHATANALIAACVVFGNQWALWS